MYESGQVLGIMGGMPGRRPSAGQTAFGPRGVEGSPMKSAKLIADLTLFFVRMVRRILEAVTKLGEEYDAASLEEFVRERSRALGAAVFDYCWALRCRERGRPASVPCSCGRRRVFKGRAERAIRTTLGEMNLPERLRYRCPVRGGETILGDELRGEGDFSELAGRLIAYAGQAVGGMFARAAKTLKRSPGIQVRGKTVENVCLRRGGRVIAAQEHAVAAPHEVKPPGALPRPSPRPAHECAGRCRCSTGITPWSTCGRRAARNSARRARCSRRG